MPNTIPLFEERWIHKEISNIITVILKIMWSHNVSYIPSFSSQQTTNTCTYKAVSANNGS